MASKPTTKETADPVNNGPNTIPDAPKLTSNSFLSPDPTSIGTESKKLNLTASSLESPTSNPPEIVAPERDIPGSNARL